MQVLDNAYVETTRSEQLIIKSKGTKVQTQYLQK